MSVFDGLNPSKSYRLVRDSAATSQPLFDFIIRGRDPREVIILSSNGDNGGKKIMEEDFTIFPAMKFRAEEIGNAPVIASMRTAAYRAPGNTAWERIEREIKARKESERLKAEGTVNEDKYVVHVGDVEENTGNVSTAVFWGVTRYPDKKTKRNSSINGY